VDVQNATLAGGVAIGAAADMYLYPGTAMAVGALAGTLSVFGFVVLSPLLEKIGVHDTCGVNNLHGMPSFFGACVAMIAANQAHVVDYGAYGLHLNFPARCTDAEISGPGMNNCEQGWSAYEQATQQLAFTAVTIAMGLAGAIFCGLIVMQRGFDNRFREPSDMFRDDLYWETPSQETPYYFDARGEIKRKEDSVTVAVRAESEELAKHRDRLVFIETALTALQSKTRSSPPAGDYQGFQQPASGSNVDNELGVLRIMMQKILGKLERS
jgi:ammonium transporter Rh